jgi:hypothetical protein
MARHTADRDRNPGQKAKGIALDPKVSRGTGKF